MYFIIMNKFSLIPSLLWLDHERKQHLVNIPFKSSGDMDYLFYERGILH